MLRWATCSSIGAALALAATLTASHAKVFLSQEEALELAFPGGAKFARETAFLTDEEARAVEKDGGGPLDSKIIHVRWSGEGGWIPMGDLDVGIGPENATSYPSPGELIFYPGGVSETELLLAYGYLAFASKAGALAGNHFATIVDGSENLRELGRRMLWDGAQDISFSER